MQKDMTRLILVLLSYSFNSVCPILKDNYAKSQLSIPKGSQGNHRDQFWKKFLNPKSTPGMHSNHSWAKLRPEVPTWELDEFHLNGEGSLVENTLIHAMGENEDQFSESWKHR